MKAYLLATKTCLTYAFLTQQPFGIPNWNLDTCIFVAWTISIFHHIVVIIIVLAHEAHNILTLLQHGFCRQHSCETQRLLTLDDLARAYNQKHQAGIGVLDFSCALDTVPHRKLLKKLSHYGITSPIHSWIESFLCHCHMWVTVECASSSTTEVDSGVHQGTVLGPLLFLVFINDLPQQVSAGTTIWLFADDYHIYRQIKSPKDQGRPSMWSWTLEKWTKVWGMCFNPTKCTVLHSHHPQPFTRFYSLWEEILSESSEAKYLSVVISSDLLCEKQVNAVSQKASNTLNFIRRNIKYCPKRPRTSPITRSSAALSNTAHLHGTTIMPRTLTRLSESTRGLVLTTLTSSVPSAPQLDYTEIHSSHEQYDF